MTEFPIILPFDQAGQIIKREQEIEGYESPKGSIGEEFSSEELFVRIDVRSAKEMVQRIKHNIVVLDPEFQRHFVWSKKKQSKLIESCIMCLPLPVFYFAERRDGKIIVVDGLQRLVTFLNFIEGDLKLTGFNKSHLLEGKKFSDLPVRLKERVLNTHLTLNILDSTATERARMEIFERVNSGTQLSRQQMRNALYSGKATNWLKSVSECKQFKMATGESFSSITMRDREAINRFVSFTLLGVQSYKGGNMDQFLVEGIKVLDSISQNEKDELAKKFKLVMKLNYIVFGEHAFRRSLVGENMEKTMINMSLFDVISVSFTNFLNKQCVKSENMLNKLNYQSLEKIVMDMLKNERFLGAITRSTNSEKAVKIRYKLLDNALNNSANYSKFTIGV